MKLDKKKKKRGNNLTHLSHLTINWLRELHIIGRKEKHDLVEYY